MRSLSLPSIVILFLTALGVPFLTGISDAPADAPRDPAKIDFKPYTETVNGKDVKVTIDMVPIEGGTFMMGSPKSEKGREENEGPQHQVTLKRFWIGKCEMTWDAYDIFRDEIGVEEKRDQVKLLMKEPDALTGPTPPYADETFGHGRAGKPALGMSYHAAFTYCRWLSKKTGKVYRLPTEAEWEYAARAGSKGAYSFGDDPKQLGEYAWYADNSKTPDAEVRNTQPVGTKKPNAWGVHDMYGNVAEWCLDQYDPGYYSKFSPDKPALQPVLVPTGTRFSHAVRGGSWADQAAQCRSAARRGSEKSWIQQDPQKPQSIWWLTDADFVGFRVIRPVEEQANLKNVRTKITWQSKDQ